MNRYLTLCVTAFAGTMLLSGAAFAADPMCGLHNGTPATGEPIKEKKFDFVLSDLRMPNGDGRFLAKEVLKMAEPKPVVFLYSGYIDIDESTFNKLGIKQIFTKPFSTVAMINSILRDLKTRTAA